MRTEAKAEERAVIEAPKAARSQAKRVRGAQKALQLSQRGKRTASRAPTRRLKPARRIVAARKRAACRAANTRSHSHNALRPHRKPLQSTRVKEYHHIGLRITPPKECINLSIVCGSTIVLAGSLLSSCAHYANVRTDTVGILVPCPCT